MKHIDGHYECDYCHGVEGSFYSDTGNHVHCQQIGEQTEKADTRAAEILALRSDLEGAKARAKQRKKTGTRTRRGWRSFTKVSRPRK